MTQELHFLFGCFDVKVEFYIVSIECGQRPGCILQWYFFKTYF